MTAEDRLQRFMDDPEGYMEECRQRARAMVERDVQRDLARRRVARRRRILRWISLGHIGRTS